MPTTPMLAQPTHELPEHLFDDRDWVMEQKLDGKRLVVKVNNREAEAYNRNGDPTSLPVNIAAFFDHQGFTGEWVFDGELVNNIYRVFDLSAVPDRVSDKWYRAPLDTRRTFLSNLLAKLYGAGATNPGSVVGTPSAVRDKRQYFDFLRDNNVEGVIFKRRESLYAPGVRSHDWLKFKFTTTADVVVTETKTDGKRQAIRIGIHHNGTLVDAGGCKVPEEFVDRINVGDVVEIRYLYATDEHKLYQPVWVALRDDKPALGCTTNQLKYTNKEVMDVEVR